MTPPNENARWQAGVGEALKQGDAGHIVAHDLAHAINAEPRAARAESPGAA